MRKNKKRFGRVYGSKVTDYLSLNTGIEIYDLAGHSEYHSSHAAMLESLCLKSPAIFVLMVDLTKSEEQLRKELYKWANFLGIQSSGITSHVIVVGSHKDKISRKSDELKSKSYFVEQCAKDTLKDQHLAGFVALDSRQLSSENLQPFLQLLAESVNALFVPNVHEKMSFDCHLLYFFLQQEVKEKAISFGSLQNLISKEPSLSCLRDPVKIASMLETIASKGLLLFLRSSKHPSTSCIVMDKIGLLQEVNGRLFAPSFFKEHCPISSNTGVVPLSNLQQFFPNYDSNILVAFMISLQFCRPINSKVLARVTTNMSPDSVTTDQLFYFPALVRVERSHNFSISKGLGWSVYCPNRRKFLTRRFQDSLLLDIAYTFCNPIPTPPELEHPDEAGRKLDRRCTVWKNGIHWTTENGIEAMVHITEENRCVSFVVSFNQAIPYKSLELCSSLIDKILTMKKELCPSVDIIEYLVSPSHLSLLFGRTLSQLTVFEMKDVSRCILLRNQFVLDVKGKERISAAALISTDPYLILRPTTVQELFESNKSTELVPACLLEEIRHHIQEIFIPQNSTYGSLQKQLNKMSIFAGRNPLVSMSDGMQVWI